ncbi:MAG: aminotransferase class I/II-fold pyridoxal phosphate-dependent enzyme [Deltaproteobacteria bacterium]|nr:aminotransferase class I/II-fold pyridoxal phosphate-dependent enzyme [Deltaproteobacteria bacterium]
MRDPIAARVRAFGTTVFTRFSALAAEHKAVNLGQGFPDFDGPAEVAEAAARALRDGPNQYAPLFGLPVLREAIAEHADRFWQHRISASDVCVTSGCTEALFDALTGLLEPGDECVLFEPFYDSYAAAASLAGATIRGVLLHPPDATHAAFWFDDAALAAAFTAKTKLILVNTPHNPTGKVFTRAELERIAALCQQHDVIAVTDEVYEHLVYDGRAHTRLAALPGMRERTLTLSSAGKTFSFTGWKIGWAIAPPALLKAVSATHQWVTFATSSPLQAAIAHALRLPDSFFTGLTRDYTARRDRMLSALSAAGLRAHAPEGSYFILADIAGRADHHGEPFTNDEEFCTWLTQHVGVAAIPPSSFYLPEHKLHGERFARFAFCKTDAVLDEAARRLEKLAQR